MMMWLVPVLLVLFFIGILFVRAARFRPADSGRRNAVEKIAVDREGAVRTMRQLIRCKTISDFDPSLEDEAEFKRLVSLLPELFPEFCKACTMMEFPGRAFLFRWKGREEGEPVVLMSHYDVVSADEEAWSHPPFDAEIVGDAVWGRGTLDNKNTLNAMLFAAETLTKEGFTPQHDLYFAVSGSEEISGDGAPSIVEYFKEQGITPSLVLDEGGAVVESPIPGVSSPCAMIGTAEKGYSDLIFTAKSGGGHASAPVKGSPIARLSAACSRLEKNPVSYRIPRPVEEMFDTFGRHASFFFRIFYANIWCFKGLLNYYCIRQGGQINAMIRSTIAFTQMKGSPAPNVIPTSASMTANIRINPSETLSDVMNHIRRVIQDDTISITDVHTITPSPISPTDCRSWFLIKNAIEETWQGCIAGPYVMTMGSDSRQYADICDKVYRFSAADMTEDEINGIHGNNEHIRLSTIEKAVEFYIRVIKKC